MATAAGESKNWIGVDEDDRDIMEGEFDDTVFEGDGDTFTAAGIDVSFYEDSDWSPSDVGVNYDIHPDGSYANPEVVEEAVRDFAGVIMESPHVAPEFAMEVVEGMAGDIWERDEYREAVDAIAQRHTYPGSSFGTQADYGVDDFVEDVVADINGDVPVGEVSGGYAGGFPS